MQILRLTQSGNAPGDPVQHVYVVASTITRYSAAYADGSRLWTLGNQGSVYVAESPDEISAMLGAGEGYRVDLILGPTQEEV